MGTRHLILVVYQDEIIFSQYGQWDGNLSGQGEDVAYFLQYEYNRKKFIEEILRIPKITQEDWDKINEFCLIPKGADYINIEQARFRAEYFPELDRNTGSKILSLIQQGKVRYKNMGYTHGKESWCDYFYVLDLDKEILEIYGYGKTIGKGRLDEQNLIALVPFDIITDETMSELEETTQKDEDD